MSAGAADLRAPLPARWLRGKTGEPVLHDRS
jgi:hypothetical protein